MSKRKVPGISSLIDTNIDSVHVIVKKKKPGSQLNESDNHEAEDSTLSPESDPEFQSEIFENLSHIEQLLHILTASPRVIKPIEKRNYEEVLPSANCTKQILKLGVTNMFPIVNIQEMVDLEYALSKSPKILKDLTDSIQLRKPGLGNVGSSLKLIMSDQLLDEYNWSGAHGKRRLSGTKLFGEILYETWFKDEMSYSEYVTEIQTAMKRVQKRLYKQRIRKRHGSGREIKLEESEHYDTN